MENPHRKTIGMVFIAASLITAFMWLTSGQEYPFAALSAVFGITGGLILQK